MTLYVSFNSPYRLFPKWHLVNSVAGSGRTWCGLPASSGRPGRFVVVKKPLRRYCRDCQRNYRGWQNRARAYRIGVIETLDEEPEGTGL